MSTTPRKGRPAGASRVEAARSGPRVPVFALVVGGLVVVLIAAFLVVRLAGGDDGEEATSAGAPATSPAAGQGAFAPVTVEGEPLPPLPDGDDPAVGAPAPTLRGRNPAGEAITIDPAQGPMVIAFVAHWCPHCQAEVPRIVELTGGEAELDGVRLVAVATGSDRAAPNYPPGPWLAEEGWPAPTMVDSQDEQAAAAFGLTGYPFLVAVDADGKVVARSSGELGDEGLRAFFAQVAA